MGGGEDNGGRREENETVSHHGWSSVALKMISMDSAGLQKKGKIQ